MIGLKSLGESLALAGELALLSMVHSLIGANQFEFCVRTRRALDWSLAFNALAHTQASALDNCA